MVLNLMLDFGRKRSCKEKGTRLCSVDFGIKIMGHREEYLLLFAGKICNFRGAGNIFHIIIRIITENFAT